MIVQNGKCLLGNLVEFLPWDTASIRNSAGNGGASELAKRITQELQAHPEWN